MLTTLSTVYLFFGGAGAGALVVLSVSECLQALRLAPAPLPSVIMARAWVIAAALLCTGALCLVLDLGRLDRVAALFTAATVSPLSVGTYALTAAILITAVFAVLCNRDGGETRPTMIVFLGVAGVVAGMVTAVYTGVLLRGLASVLFWQTPLLPALFLLSAVSCGFATVFLAAAFTETRFSFLPTIRRLACADSLCIVAELVVLAVWLRWGLAAVGTHDAAWALLGGSLCARFWLLVVAGGLILPLLMERFICHANYQSQLLWIAGLLFVGSLVLRLCVVGTGAFDVTQMESVGYGLLF